MQLNLGRPTHSAVHSACAASRAVSSADASPPAESAAAVAASTAARIGTPIAPTEPVVRRDRTQKLAEFSDGCLAIPRNPSAATIVQELSQG